jgi:hypothetical protein
MALLDGMVINPPKIGGFHAGKIIGSPAWPE